MSSVVHLEDVRKLSDVLRGYQKGTLVIGATWIDTE